MEDRLSENNLTFADLGSTNDRGKCKAKYSYRYATDHIRECQIGTNEWSTFSEIFPLPAVTYSIHNKEALYVPRKKSDE